MRLGANTLRGTTLSRLAELWETIRETDLSHSLDLPSGERLANGSAWLLMALKGREVLGLLSAERIAGTSSACLDSSGSGMKQKSEADASKADIGQRTKPTLGVAVVWVRRRERRRGLATSLVDCLRRLNGGGSVAFSQPTELGFNFASSYSCRQHTGPLVYDPDWSDESK